MSIPPAVFSQPTKNIHSAVITPHLSAHQRSVLENMELSQQEQVKLEAALRQRFQEASMLTAASLGLAEKARQRQREALIGDVAAGKEQLERQELQERQGIAHQFAAYAGAAASNAASRGIVDSRSTVQDQVMAAQSAQRASAVSQANRQATQQQFLRQAAFSAEAQDLNFMQDVLAAAGDLSALRHQTTASLFESRSRLRSLQLETEALRNQFLQQNLQEGITAFQQKILMSQEN